MELFWTVFWVSAVAGPVLLVIGLRGKRVGNERFCKTCGYDVSKVNPSVRCSECGSSIANKRDVLIGRRQKQRRIVAAGLITLCVCGVLAIHVLLGTKHLVRVQPNSLLMPQLRHSLGGGMHLAGRFRIGEELSHRASSGKISDKEMSRLLPYLLRFHERSVREAADNHWLDSRYPSFRLLEECIDRGLLSSKQTSDLLRNSIVRWEFEHTARRASGSPIFYYEPVPYLIWPFESYSFISSSRPIRYRLNGEEIDLEIVPPRQNLGTHPEMEPTFVHLGPGRAIGTLTGLPDWVYLPNDPLPIGEHRASLTREMHVWLVKPSFSLSTRRSIASLGQHDYSVELVQDYPITVVDQPEDHITLTTDPEMYPFQNGYELQITYINLDSQSRSCCDATRNVTGTINTTDGRHCIQLDLAIQADFASRKGDETSPIPWGGRLSLKAGSESRELQVSDRSSMRDRPWDTARVCIAYPHANFQFLTVCYPFDVAYNEVELLITPDISVAVDDYKIERMWGKPITTTIELDWSQIPEADRPPLPPETPSPNP